MTNLEELAAAVERITTAEESAVALVEGIASRIADAGTNPEALRGIREELVAAASKLAAAVVANTPASAPPVVIEVNEPQSAPARITVPEVPAPTLAGAVGFHSMRVPALADTTTDVAENAAPGGEPADEVFSESP